MTAAAAAVADGDSVFISDLSQQNSSSNADDLQTSEAVDSLIQCFDVIGLTAGTFLLLGFSSRGITNF